MKFHAKKFTAPRGKSVHEDEDNDAPKAGKRGFLKRLFAR
jgi:hypothetical protein